MTTKEWLNRGYEIDKEIKLLEEEKRTAFDRLTSFGCPDGEKVKCSSGNTMENKLISYVAYDEKIEQRIKKLYEVKSEILNTILKIDKPVLRLILIMRYINYKKWDTIANELSYSLRNVHRLHEKALKKAGEVLDLSFECVNK